MPTPRHFLGHRLRGFICKACLSKSHIQQRSLWGFGSPGANEKPSVQAPKAEARRDDVARYFEEDSQGNRQEVENIDSALHDMGRTVAAKIKEIEDSLGPIDPELYDYEEKQAALEDELENDLEEMEALKNPPGGMTDEHRLRIKDYLLRWAADDEEAKTPKSRKEKSAKKYGLGEEALQDLTKGLPRELAEDIENEADLEDEDEKLTDHEFWEKHKHEYLSPVEGKWADRAEQTAIPLGGDKPYEIPCDSFPKRTRIHIMRLNRNLKTAFSVQWEEVAKEDDRSDFQHEMWRSYVLVRSTLSRSFQEEQPVVPPMAWDLLWTVFATAENPENPNRLAHLKMLGEQIEESQVSMQDYQHMLFLEACAIEGPRDEAIERWQAATSSLGENEETKKDFWEMGARMYALDGKPHEARRAAGKLLRISSEPDSHRVLIPIISSFLAHEKPEKTAAWDLYLQLRRGLGSDIEMKDYDSVISAFMNASEMEAALAIFRDMMLTGDASAQLYDSISTDSKKVDHEVGQFSRSFPHLPPHFNNKFFYGKWIKKLIGDGDYAGAHHVMGLMLTRGICPDAKYVNGLIGAWFRTGISKNQEMGEVLAWAMIRERLAFKKRPAYSATSGLTAQLSSDKPDHKRLFRYPLATIETFAVLVEGYRMRRKTTETLALFQTLAEARIPANVSFMNQVLMSEVRHARQKFAFDVYLTLVKQGGVRPDAESFEALWKIMRWRIEGSRTEARLVDQDMGGFSPRTLFAEMVRHRPSFKYWDESARETYQTIILCFGLCHDEAGAAVAMKAMYQKFGMLPNEVTASNVIAQLAGRGHGVTRALRQRNKRIAKVPTALQRDVSTRLAKLTEARVAKLEAQGIVYEELDMQEKLKGTLDLLVELLKSSLGQRATKSTGEELVQYAFERAAAEMGV